MDKQSIINKLIERLESELRSVLQAARAAHEAATHQEAKAENQYDTRGLEASYLAGAQAQRAAEIQAQILSYRQMDARALAPSESVRPGALVELELDAPAKRRSRYLLVPRGGGVSVQQDGETIQALAPGSPMGEALMGRKAGDFIEVEGKDSVREYRIVAVS